MGQGRDDVQDEPDDEILVDALGLPCPQPVIELASAVRAAAIGARIRLVADDPAARVDVPVWCRMQHQRLVRQDRDGKVFTFVVEKIAEPA